MPAEKKLTRAEQKLLRPLQILEAAFEEFIARGFSAARVEDVAERIGVTKGTIYVYFETKEKLFESMIEHVSTPFKAAFQGFEIEGGDPLTELKALLRFLFENIVAERRMRELFRLVVSEGRAFPDLIDRHHSTFMEPVFIKVDEILDAGAARGIFRENSAELSKLVVAPVVGTVVFRLIFDDRRAMDIEDVLSTHFDVLLNGLKAKTD